MANVNNQEPDKTQQMEGTQTPAAENNADSRSLEIDYGKLDELIGKRVTVAEKGVLKSYFKEQGLSEEEAAEAIKAYKANKQAQTPDVSEISNQLAEAQKTAALAELEKAATLEALTLEIDPKTIPHVLKLADFSACRTEDGKISAEALKAALEKVLEEVPAFKSQKEDNLGFQQIGAGSGTKEPGGLSAISSVFGNTK